MSDIERTALVIEDDPDARHMLVRALEDIGLGAFGVGSGEEALAWVETHHAPSVVTVDIALPAMSGLRVCEWLRSSPGTREVPIIVVTARTDVQDMAAALQLGAAYLAKPFHLQELTDIVTQLLWPNGRLRVTPTAGPQSVHFWSRPAAGPTRG